jgi:uncharacterized protein
MDFNYLYLLLLIPAAAGLVGRSWVRTMFDRYSRIPASSGASGEEVARTLLARYELEKVEIERAPGALTDHYDSNAQRLRLSEDVAAGRSISSTGIAAHEAAHALQDAEAGRLHRARRQIGEELSRLAPWSGLLLVGGLWFGIPVLTALMVVFLVVSAVFAAVTLPVEVMASRNAIRDVERFELATAEEIPAVRRVLRAAAFTYVANLAHRLGIVLFLVVGAMAARGLS